MKKEILLKTAVIALFLGAVCAAKASPEPSSGKSQAAVAGQETAAPHAGQHKGVMARLAKKLDLTPEQEKQLADLKADSREKMAGLHKEMRARAKELGEELDKQDYSQNKARRIHEEIKAVRARVEDARFEDLLAARKILSAEQFAKFHKIMQREIMSRLGAKGANRGEQGRQILRRRGGEAPREKGEDARRD